MATNKTIHEVPSITSVGLNDYFLVDQKNSGNFISKSIKGGNLISQITDSASSTIQPQIDEINNDLTLKANVSGQVFTGDIQSPTISTNAINIVSTTLVDSDVTPLTTSKYFLKININGQDYVMPLYTT